MSRFDPTIIIIIVHLHAFINKDMELIEVDGMKYIEKVRRGDDHGIIRNKRF